MPRHLKDLDYSVLQQCMHCGMCLPDCPTYRTTKIERHSPRGRIALMRAVADGELEMGKELADEMDYCLGCLACVSACPAGVDYLEMFETARAEGELHRHGKLRRLLRRGVFEGLFLHPWLLITTGKFLRLYQQSGIEKIVRTLKLPRLLGRKMAELETQTPRMEARFSDDLIAEIERPPAGIPVRGRVGFLSGCVQAMAFASVNRATVDVLLQNGWEVQSPRLQPCCGSIHAHNGESALAERSARALIDSFELDSLDAIISNSGGCGGHLKRYHHILPNNPQAIVWDAKLKDVHEFLIEKGFRHPEVAPVEPLQVTYHDSCHLCHGQGISRQPRDILRSIPGLELIELAGASECCGSAGIYNVLQPEESARQLERKIAKIQKTGASMVALANPGCHLQIARGLENSGVQVTQPVQLLAEAYCRSTDV